MELFDKGIDVEKGLALADRVHPKYKPVFDVIPKRDRAALALYFLPHRSRKESLEVTRPRVIKWYCPFADQRHFKSGHRYCINVYTGCSHECRYCYAKGYSAAEANCKSAFRSDLARDLEDLERYDVAPAPVHISNSTDPLQPLEAEHRHTFHVLEQLVQQRHRFTTVTLLTKNPEMLMDERYILHLRRLNSLSKEHPRYEDFQRSGLPPLRIECSLAFYDDRARLLLDPEAPGVASRIEAIRFLRGQGIPVVLRIDPLFPRNPLRDGKMLGDFGLPDIQPLADIENLVRFSREVGAMHIVYSVAKITRPRFDVIAPVMLKFKEVYEHLANGQSLVFRGGSWRLPDDIAMNYIVAPLLDICRRYEIQAKVCKENLISTP